MNGISAVIITKNEEAHLGRCLKSLDGIADEMIVVDSFSTDRTPEIAAEFGARFLSREWEGYARTKNLGNAEAKFSHILWLDADEALSPELKASLSRVKQSLSGGYTFNRLNNYCGKWIRHGGWYPDRKLRLFPKEKAHWEGDFVHESLVADADLEIRHLQGDLLHYTYSSISDHLHRAEKYARLGAKQIAASKKSNLALKSILSPLVRWIKGYLFQGGFLDGREGWHIARIAAKETRLKYREAMKLRGE